MTEHLPLPGIALNDGLMQAWLALAAAEGPDDDPVTPAAVPVAARYGWWPDLPGAGAAAEELVRLAVAAGILTSPAGVTPALQYYRGQRGRRYRVLVTIPGPGGDGPLTLASRPRPWRQIGAPGACGPDAAAAILTEVTAAANRLLGSLASYLRQAPAVPAPGAVRR